MVQVPTNYKMGTGLAATIMGQQAGLESEQQGLANLMKGMQMPAEALKGQEAAMLMQNPEYLQQKTANTLIELKNTYSAQDFQQTLDAANRVRIKLDAAGGDPAKEQQIVQESLAAMQIDPNSEFAQYAMKDPRGAITKFIQGVEVGLTGTGGAKQLGAEKLAGIKGENALELAQARGDLQEKLLGKRLAATGGGAPKPLGTDKMLVEMITKANAGDPAAQEWVNTYTQIQRAKNPSFGGMALNPQGGMTTKGEANPLPFSPKVQPKDKGKVINLDEQK